VFSPATPRINFAFAIVYTCCGTKKYSLVGIYRKLFPLSFEVAKQPSFLIKKQL
jgi:hypothetical protein